MARRPPVKAPGRPAAPPKPLGGAKPRELGPGQLFPCNDPLHGRSASGERYAGQILGCATPPPGARGPHVVVGQLVPRRTVKRDVDRKAAKRWQGERAALESPRGHHRPEREPGRAPITGLDLALDVTARPSAAIAQLPLDVSPSELRPPGAPPFTFWLGAHHASWLAESTVPLFLSRRALVLDPAKRGSTPAQWAHSDRQRKTLPRALRPWRLDSAGFTELNQFGCHHIPPAQYAAEVCRYQAEIGLLDAAFVQDWMCEPDVLAITGADVERHQMRSIESLFVLRTLAPNVKWAPVLQGWKRGDHERHLALYYRNGIDLRCEPVVGVGSVCRRQGMVEADTIVRDLSGCDLRLHLLGYKFTGLPQTLHYVASADSMAWSTAARERKIRMPGHDHEGARGSERWELDGNVAWLRTRRGTGWEVLWGPEGSAATPVPSKAAGAELLRGAGYAIEATTWTCNNCLPWAMEWRRQMLAKVFLGADADALARFYGHREPTHEELAAFDPMTGHDPAEGYQLADVVRGDYDLARAKVSAVAGVEVPETPRCHFLHDPGTTGCAPASYEPPRAPRRPWPKAPAVTVQPLPPGRPAARVPFVPWAPALVLGAAPRTQARKPQPAHASPEAARALGRSIGERVVDRSDASYARTPFEFYAITENDLDERLAKLPEHAEFENGLKAWGADPRREQVRAAYEGAMLDAIWSASRRAVPEFRAPAKRPR